MTTRTAGYHKAGRVFTFILVLMLSFSMVPTQAFADPAQPDGAGVTPLAFNVTPPSDAPGVIAKVVVAQDAPAVGAMQMVKSTQWLEEGTTEWLTTPLTPAAGHTYYLYTPLSGMVNTTSATILPNVKADVTVELTSNVAAVGDNFMQCYARNCTNLTSLGVPDLTNVTTVGNNFLYEYAQGCTGLQSLGVPTLPVNLTTVGNNFLYEYARGCTGLQSMVIPDTSHLTTLGTSFMAFYAYGCTGLQSLGVPILSESLTSVPDYFMYSYAQNCTGLTKLYVPDTSHLTTVGNSFMRSYAQGCTGLTPQLDAPDTSHLTSIGTYFMASYANGCTNLTLLGIPTVASGTTVSTSNFMASYASGCAALVRLDISSAPGYFADNNVNWTVKGAQGLRVVVPPETLDAWRALTATGKTLATNTITDAAKVEARNGQEDAPFSITVQETSHGTVSTDFALLGAKEGYRVTLTVTPATGYRLKAGSLVAAFGDTGTVDIAVLTPNTFAFTMPAAAVTVTAQFEVMGAIVSPGDGVVATIVVADDAIALGTPKAMVKSSQWSADGTTWLTTALNPVAGKTYYLFTPLSGMGNANTAALPNIKSTVTVELKLSPDVTSVGNYFMYYYANGCANLTSLAVPDVSSLTSVGTYFMANYANNCTGLTSLGVPILSESLTSAPNYFMQSYALSCTGLTKLDVPDTSHLTSIGTYFMSGYANNCTNLASLGIPAVNVSTVGANFMTNYANLCAWLEKLVMSSGPGYFATANIDWKVTEYDEPIIAVVPYTTIKDWQALTAAGKTLNMNKITIPEDVKPDKTFTLSGTVSIEGTARFGATLTAVSSTLTGTPLVPIIGVPITEVGTLSYEWKRGETTVGTEATYTLAADDIGATITVTLSAEYCTGTLTSDATATVAKPVQDAPDAPTLAGQTTTSITLVAIEGAQYRLGTEGIWQDSPVFSSLTPNTAYTFYARLAATTTHDASEPSAASATFTTETQIYTLDGTVGISGTAVYGQTLTADTSALASTPQTALGTLTYQWRRGETPVGNNSATYTLTAADINETITVVVTAANCEGSVTSQATGTIAKAVAAAPAAPTLASRTATSITLASIEGAEYRLGTEGTWQDSPLFDNLTPETGYTFFARLAATATHDTSETSDQSATIATTATPPAVTEVIVTPATPSVQKGATQQFTATVDGSNNPPQTVTWSVLGSTGGSTMTSTGRLSIGANEAAATLTVRATSTYDTSRSGTTTVTVTDAPAPTYTVSLDTSDYTFPAATAGYGAQAAKTVTVANTGNQASGALSVSLTGTPAASFTLSAVLIASIPVGGQATFTIVPKTGLAAGTYTATVTVSGVNILPESFNVSFTVTEPAPKPITELPALSLQVGTKALSTITLNDADGQPITAQIAVTGFDTQVIEVGYDAATKALSILALAKGETTITLASDAAAESYTMAVTVTAAATPAPTLDAGSTGVKVTGTVKNIPEGAAVKAIIRALTSGSAFDSLSAEASGRGSNVLSLFEVVLTINGKEVHDGFGTLTLAFPVDATYEGKEITVLHLHHDGTLTSENVRVSDGKATVKVSDLSAFALTVTKPSSGTGTLVPNTSNTGSTNTSNTGSTGSLVSNSGNSSGSNSSGTGSLVTSQTGTQNESTDTTNDDSEVAFLEDTDVPLSRVNAFDSANPASSVGNSSDTAASTTQQGGMNPWVLAIIIGLAVLALALVLWLIVRRRRQLAAEVFAEGM